MTQSFEFVVYQTELVHNKKQEQQRLLCTLENTNCLRFDQQYLLSLGKNVLL